VTRFLVRRVLLTIPVLCGVATLVFALIRLVPGDPVQAMLGEGATPQDIAQLRTALGLDRPMARQYAAFMRRAIVGDLGTSLRTGQPVSRVIAERLPATFELAAAATVLALFIGIPLGISAAVRAGTAIDHAATTLALLGISLPTFWVGPLLAWVFAVTLGGCRSRAAARSRTSSCRHHARCAARGRPGADDACQSHRRTAGTVRAGGAREARRAPAPSCRTHFETA
jgi:peptide/nickel transport system permease protein